MTASHGTTTKGPDVSRLPNFIYIGPDKAGSSWLHDVLIEHPQVFMTPAKDLYFFDRYFDKGVDWYAAHFEQGHRRDDRRRGLPGLPVPPRGGRAHRAESSTRRGSWSPCATRSTGPSRRTCTCSRWGSSRARSARRCGRGPELLEHGRYGIGLDRFADRFGDDSIYVAVFDDLRADPRGSSPTCSVWLGVEPFELTDELLATRLPASKARSAWSPGWRVARPTGPASTTAPRSSAGSSVPRWCSGCCTVR